jgi:pyruvate kinase
MWPHLLTREYRKLAQISPLSPELSPLSPGQQVIITAGVPLGKSGATNLLRIAEVGTGTDE